MATIVKRESGHYQAKIRKVGFPTVSQTFKKKVLAEKWVRNVESEMDLGSYLNTSMAESLSLAEALDQYSDQVAPEKKSCDNIRSRLNTLKKHLGHYTLINVTPKVLADYRDFRLNKFGENPENAVSGESVRKELTVLNAVFKQCLTEWHINLPLGNPLEKVQRPPKGKPRKRRLENTQDGSEENQLLTMAQSTNSVIGDILVFALETSMRRSEIANMLWENVSYEKRTVELVDTKNGTNRTVPLSLRALEILKQQKFLSEKVFNMRSDSIGRAFRRLCQKCGITGLKFHDFRHEGTSRLVEKGLQILEVAAITGHKDLRTLMQYTHLRAEDLALKLDTNLV